MRLLSIFNQEEKEALPIQFWTVWFSGTVTNLGDGVVGITLPLVATLVTRDPLLIAFIETARFVSIPLFSLFVGLWLDRYNRRWAKVFADSFRIFLMTALLVSLFANSINIIFLYIVSFLLGIAELTADSAFSILVKQTVSKSKLEQAYSRVYTGTIISDSFLGPPLGAWLFSLATVVPFIFHTLALAVSAVLITRLQGSYQTRSNQITSGTLVDIREGLHFLWSSSTLRTLSLATGAISLANRAFFAIFVLYVLEVLSSSELTYGMLSMAFGIGGFVGSMSATRLIQILNRTFVLKLCIVTLMAAYGVLYLTPPFIITWTALFATGFAIIVWGIIGTSIRQRLVPDQLLGRVGGSHRLLSSGLSPLGSLLGGVLARQFNLTTPLLFTLFILCITGVFVQIFLQLSEA